MRELPRLKGTAEDKLVSFSDALEVEPFACCWVVWQTNHMWVTKYDKPKTAKIDFAYGKDALYYGYVKDRFGSWSSGEYGYELMFMHEERAVPSTRALTTKYLNENNIRMRFMTEEEFDTMKELYEAGALELW
jgi:hypothetical protein